MQGLDVLGRDAPVLGPDGPAGFVRPARPSALVADAPRPLLDEVLADRAVQVLAAERRNGQPRVPEGLGGGHARRRVDGQQAADERLRGRRDFAPVLNTTRVEKNLIHANFPINAILAIRLLNAQISWLYFCMADAIGIMIATP